MPSSAPEEFDVVILGSGEGTKNIAWTLGKQGQRIAVVERKYIGGSCPNIACLPSKNVVHSAKIASCFRRANEFGISVPSFSVDMAGVRQRKRNAPDDARGAERALRFLSDRGVCVERYDEWHHYFKKSQPPTLVVWGKGDVVFLAPGAEAYKRDLKTIEVHYLDAGHFALETNAAEIAGYMRTFLDAHAKSSVAK